MNEDLIKLKEEELKYLEEKLASLLTEYEERNKDGKVVDMYILTQIIILLLFLIQFFISPVILIKVVSILEVLGFTPFVYKGIKYIKEEKDYLNKLKIDINKLTINKGLIIYDLEMLKSNVKDLTESVIYDNANIKENSIQNTKNKVRKRTR